MKNILKVACLQMTSSNSLEQNLHFIDLQMQLARDLGVDLIRLPENFAQMPKLKSDLHIEAPDNGPVQSFLSACAKRYQMMIIAGSLPVQERAENKPYARCMVYDLGGDNVATYNKIHLFDVDLPNTETYKESSSYLPGELINSSLTGREFGNLTVVNTDLAKIGLSICYDLRFPELYRVFAAQEVEIIMVPSAFTATTGQAHWRTLLRARAIENQAFVMAAAQTGTHDNNRETWGHSMIIDPWGEVLAEFDEEHQAPSGSLMAKVDNCGLLIMDIDLGKLSELRMKFPSQSHRRL